MRLHICTSSPSFTGPSKKHNYLTRNNTANKTQKENYKFIFNFIDISPLQQTFTGDPFKPDGFSHPNQLDKSISCFGEVFYFKFQ